MFYNRTAFKAHKTKGQGYKHYYGQPKGQTDVFNERKLV